MLEVKVILSFLWKKEDTKKRIRIQRNLNTKWSPVKGPKCSYDFVAYTWQILLKFCHGKTPFLCAKSHFSPKDTSYCDLAAFSLTECPLLWKLQGHTPASIMECSSPDSTLGRGVNGEGFHFKLAMVKTCSTWPLLNKYALWKKNWGGTPPLPQTPYIAM